MLRQATTFNTYRGHRQIIAPDVEPVFLQDLKDQLRICGTDEDIELSLFVLACREYIESLTGRAMINQTWRLTLDQWPTGGRVWWDGIESGSLGNLEKGRAWLYLPRYRLQSVTQIRVFDEAGNPSTVNLNEFIVDGEQEPGRLLLRNNAVWPIALQRGNAIQIDYVAGYGDTPDDVPGALRLAVLQMAANLYQHRGDDCSEADAFNKSGAASLLRAFRVARI
jgi:hypothetical protein